MTQILVTIEDQSAVSAISKAIEMLKGVIKTSVFVGKDDESASKVESAHRTVSPRLERLCGIAKNISEEQIAEDDKLAYLLNK